MLETKHSPGPFRVTVSGTGQDDSRKRHPVTGQPYQEPSALDDANGHAIARFTLRRDCEDFQQSLDRRWANAWLLEAAPEMLETLGTAYQALDALMIEAARHPDQDVMVLMGAEFAKRAVASVIDLALNGNGEAVADAS